MSEFSIGDFCANDAEDVWGFTFSPGVSGPNGEGSPQSSGVTLVSLAVGYPPDGESPREDTCYVFDTKLDDPSQITEDSDHLVARSSTCEDHTPVFGVIGSARTYYFDPETSEQLGAGGIYYVYFERSQ